MAEQKQTSNIIPLPTPNSDQGGTLSEDLPADVVPIFPDESTESDWGPIMSGVVSRKPPTPTEKIDGDAEGDEEVNKRFARILSGHPGRIDWFLHTAGHTPRTQAIVAAARKMMESGEVGKGEDSPDPVIETRDTGKITSSGYPLLLMTPQPNNDQSTTSHS